MCECLLDTTDFESLKRIEDFELSEDILDGFDPANKQFFSDLEDLDNPEISRLLTEMREIKKQEDENWQKYFWPRLMELRA